MLIDTACDRTMVSKEMVEPSKVNWEKTTPVVCIHGDMMLYPTAKVQLHTEGWTGEREVVVAPRLPVSVLLGRDSVQREERSPNHGLAAVTRSQTRQAAAGTEPEIDTSDPGDGDQDQRGMRTWSSLKPYMNLVRRSSMPHPGSSGSRRMLP